MLKPRAGRIAEGRKERRSGRSMEGWTVMSLARVGGGSWEESALEENEQSHSLLMRGVRVFLCCVLEVGLPFYIDTEALGANFRLLYKGQVGSDWAIGGEFLALNLLCLYCAEGTIILIQK